MELIEKIHAAADFLADELKGFVPEVGIILGSGLGKLAGKIGEAKVIPYSKIPGFPVSTAIGHAGNLVAGKISGKNVIAMQGRFHHYEGYPTDIAAMPIRVFKLLGIKYLFVSNAAGGTNTTFKVGDMMVITDHINLIPNPLIGHNLDEFGPRFPDMTRPYSPKLIALAEEKALEMGISLKKGVYLGCTGPCFETPAEYAFFRKIGADAVGMSTTPEVIVANHCSIPVFGMSVITDVAHELEEDYVTDGNAIVAAADAAADRMTALFENIIASL